MTYFLISLMMSLNLTFCFLKHPMTLGTNLLIQTIVVTLLMGKINKTFWFSYIMFLIMIGALIVLFIYMTSLNSNEKFKFNYKFFLFFISSFLLMIFYLIMIDQLPLFLKTLIEEVMKFLNEINNNSNNQESFIMSWMYNQSEMLMTFILINYLLYVLFIIVKIINIKKGTMRKIKN